MPGLHPNLQADRPFPAFASIQINENFGRNWYHALQTKVERRFSGGLAFTFSYSYSRSMMENTPECETCSLAPFSSASYNRGRTPFDRRHIEYATVVWEVPFGKGKKYGSSMNRPVDLLAGGWQLNFTHQGQSGAPLNISACAPSLRNCCTPRANAVSAPTVSDPGPSPCFN